MVKVSFNNALAFKDPKKESLIPDGEDPEAAVLVRPRSKVLWCCFYLGLALIVSGVVLGAALLYKYQSIFMPSHVQGVMDGRVAEREDDYIRFPEYEHWECSLPYNDEDYETDEEEKTPLMLEENVRFYEDDEVELINVPVPEFRDGDSAGIMHDFTMKLTAYLDLDLNKCFIITLNTSIVMPPRDFQEFLVNIKAGMYLPQTYIIREEMMVTERLDSTSDLGYYINDLCKDKDTYRLQHRDMTLGMQKREALNCHKIRHFENKFVVETLICEP